MFAKIARNSCCCFSNGSFTIFVRNEDVTSALHIFGELPTTHFGLPQSKTLGSTYPCNAYTGILVVNISLPSHNLPHPRGINNIFIKNNADFTILNKDSKVQNGLHTETYCSPWVSLMGAEFACQRRD